MELTTSMSRGYMAAPLNRAHHTAVAFAATSGESQASNEGSYYLRGGERFNCSCPLACFQLSSSILFLLNGHHNQISLKENNSSRTTNNQK